MRLHLRNLATAPAAVDPDTIIVIRDGRALKRSDAALAVAAELPFPLQMFGGFRVLPRGVRDRRYRLVVRNRYG